MCKLEKNKTNKMHSEYIVVIYIVVIGIMRY